MNNYVCKYCGIELKRQGNHWWKHEPIKAQLVIKSISSKQIGRKAWNKGQSWEESYGKEGAQRMKDNHKDNYVKNFHSNAARIKAANSRKGIKRPAEFGQKISESLIGRKLSSEHCYSISLYHADVSGSNNPMYGRRGPLCPAWDGGKSFEPYPFIFNDILKMKIKHRDNYKCQNCFSTGDKRGRLYIHHINYDKNNCSDYNLITTCSSCNSKANFKRDDWKAFYMDKIDAVYSNPTVLVF